MYYIYIYIIGNKTTAMMPCRHYRALRMEKVHGLSHYTWVYESIYLNLCFYKCDICIFIRNAIARVPLPSVSLLLCAVAVGTSRFPFIHGVCTNTRFAYRNFF